MTTLLDLWKKTKDEVKNLKADQNYKLLKAQSQVDVIEAKNAIDSAVAGYETAKLESINNKNSFAKMVCEKVKLREAEVRYEIAVAVFVDCFGEEPRV